MSKPFKVLVIGGAGFIGQAVCNQLARAGAQITVPTRRLAHAKHLLTLPTCRVVQANIHDRAALGRLVAGQDAVVNLLGVLHSRRGKPYGQEFRTNHVEFPKALTTSMIQHRVKRLVHISALGVGVQNPAPSMYLRSKTDGEAIVKDSGLAWTILRPSVVFGPDDRFLNLFAGLTKLFPVIPLAGANTRFQPVSVSDVAAAVVSSLTDKNRDTVHNTYDLAGPDVLTLKELVAMCGKAVGASPWIVGLPVPAAKAQAFLMELAPGAPLMSRDNVDSMRIDNVRTAGQLFPLAHYDSVRVSAPPYLAARFGPSELDLYRNRRQSTD